MQPVGEALEAGPGYGRGALGAEPVGSTPAEFGAFVRAEHARWSKVIREKGIRSE